MHALLHISDLHFSHVTYHPSQIFSKRWIGNLNLLLFRKRQIATELIPNFFQLVDRLQPSSILISGDFTSTALPKEFELAKEFLLEIKKRKIQIFGIPGNHDTYTKKAYKRQTFYRHFRGLLPFEGAFGFDLEKHRVAAFLIEPDHYLILIDASCYTPYFQSNGHFNFQIEQHLEALLGSLPRSSKIWICCHYPFFAHEHPKRILIGGNRLQRILEKHPSIELYFHGHTHRQTLCDLRSNQLPIISDPGSLTLRKKSAFHHLLYNKDQIQIARYTLDQADLSSPQPFTFQRSS